MGWDSWLIRPHRYSGLLMAVPKRRMSRSNTRSRRSQWKAAAPDLVPLQVDSVVHRVPRRLLRAHERGLLELP